MTATRASRDIRVAFAVALLVLPAALPAQQARLARVGAAPRASDAPPAPVAIVASDTDETTVNRPKRIVIGVVSGVLAGGVIGFVWPVDASKTTNKEAAFYGLDRPINGIVGALIGAAVGGFLGAIW
jgi:hypothetical protein